ncbi:hypothetical protein MKW94_025018 [Papaver nudicaule]|uniref:Metallo-beta-lactamase domain-containing protein n=1 Tax=Papaver nudicaule TaxID=74823 RepID=A0AA41SEH9_PAPNU|nr:hypothetical protein [Papaver nudicaule]
MEKTRIQENPKKESETQKKKKGIEIEAFDIGRCPHYAVSQDYLFISHGHLDHIGGLPSYVATRGLLKMKPPTIFIPKSIKEHVERLFEVYRAMSGAELNHILIGLDVGEERKLGENIKVKTFKTYHRVPSQGYIVYLNKRKLKQEYVGLSDREIKTLKLSGVEITNTLTSPEIAFTGDTTSDFITDPNNADALKARILVMESTFVDDTKSVEHAKDHGNTHLSEIVEHADKFENKAILLIHFLARYEAAEIQAAVSGLPPSLVGRVHALTKGF